MTSTQWANIGDDPGALHALVDSITQHADVAVIDSVWIFPARRVAVGESIVVVIAVIDEDPDRRSVRTAHFTVSRNRKGAATINTRFEEHGSAPVPAVPRIVQGVLRRLGEDTESPGEIRIGGDQDRWDAFIVELGGAPRRPEASAEASPNAEPNGDIESSADAVAGGEVVGAADVGIVRDGTISY